MNDPRNPNVKSDQAPGLLPEKEIIRLQEDVKKIIDPDYIEGTEARLWDLFYGCIQSDYFDQLTPEERGNIAATYQQTVQAFRSLERYRFALYSLHG